MKSKSEFQIISKKGTTMKNPCKLAILALALLVVPSVRAQDTPTPTAPAPPSQPETGLKVQVVISEFNGTQKLSSFPYTLNIVKVPGRTATGSVRMGTKVPISVGVVNSSSGTANTQYTYQDVGTNIDCRLETSPGPDGRYHISFSIQRSSVISPNGADVKQGDALPSQPLIRSFQDSFDVILRDGQTVQGSASVDPATGNVVKVDVSLDLQK
jgi:hypothetical protein